ncbi:hypothetical protein JHK87_012072 [Glycine soja]|nr:hypothetical protein JHK87_012072 [Glycine soja]
MGLTKPKVPFHVSTIKKPQHEYNIFVDNTNLPFNHVWLKWSHGEKRFIHPLESLSVMSFVDTDVGDVVPVKAPPIESTPFKLVETVQDLKELAAKLHSADEFAVDLEHNQYRTFQGLTCLMQISTRTEDFIVDTLKLHSSIGPYLREVFKDPSKRKVMHGADNDVVWLQRDFGIYICNLFDTHQASKVLKLERKSLEYLLCHFCDITANKEYAREDTHYLLYIYDFMRIELFSMLKEPESVDAPLVEMPVTANNLRLLVNSRHPYVEHNLDSLVNIIRHSIQNTAAFEEIAQLLKTGHDVATIAQQLTRHPAQEHNRHPIRIGSQVMEGFKYILSIMSFESQCITMK